MLDFLSFNFCLLLLFSLTSSSATDNDPVVNTSSGPVKGKLLSVDSGSVMAFLGIPYAEPPLGNLRFQKPHPHQPWSQVLEATHFGNSCPQHVLHGIPDADIWKPNTPLSEDCLFLNIWVPHPQPSTPTPVLVWIHGGGFFLGTASLDLYNGASLAAKENVIVVSMNYRLGALGFLSLPPATLGNMGLWDQQLALTWIKENAAVFGGDPNRVTILGHSAGAASVGFHLLSPKSQPLFANAVLQSGAPNAIWAWVSPEEARRKSLLFSQLLGCKEGNESEIVRCLKEKNAMEFAQHEMSISQTSKFFLELPFSPTTDGEFLTDEPQKLLEAGHLQVKPTLIGTTSDEGSILVLYFSPGTDHNLITWDQLLHAVNRTMQNATKEDIQAVSQKYSEEDTGPARYYQAMTHSFSDYYFVCPAAEYAAQARKAGSSLYVYAFTHHTSGSIWPKWTGATHGAELPYVFGNFKAAMNVNKTHTEAESTLSHRVMQYWAEFARSGNPTGSEANDVVWPLYNSSQENFFHLSTEPSTVMEVSPARHCGLFRTKFAQPKKLEEDSRSAGKEEDGESSPQ